MTDVLPEPAPANTKVGEEIDKTASFCFGFKPSKGDVDSSFDMIESNTGAS